MCHCGSDHPTVGQLFQRRVDLSLVNLDHIIQPLVNFSQLQLQMLGDPSHRCSINIVIAFVFVFVFVIVFLLVRSMLTDPSHRWSTNNWRGALPAPRGVNTAHAKQLTAGCTAKNQSTCSSGFLRPGGNQPGRRSHNLSMLSLWALLPKNPGSPLDEHCCGTKRMRTSWAFTFEQWSSEI